MVDLPRSATPVGHKERIKSQEKATLAGLDKEKDARHTARQTQYDKDIQASEDAVKAAREEWQAALDEAARKRAEIAEAAGPGAVKGAGDLEGLDIEGMGKKAARVQGTFSAMAVRGLESGGPAERTAKATEQIVKNTGELVKESKLGGPKFS